MTSAAAALAYRGGRGYRWAALACGALAFAAAAATGVGTGALGPIGELSEVDAVVTIAGGRLPSGQPLTETARTAHDCRGGVLGAARATLPCGSPGAPQQYPDGGRSLVGERALGWSLIGAGWTAATPLWPLVDSLRLLAALGWALGVGLLVWCQRFTRTPLAAAVTVALLLIPSGPGLLLGAFAGPGSLSVLAGASLLLGVVLAHRSPGGWAAIALIAQAAVWAILLPAAPILLLATALMLSIVSFRAGPWSIGISRALTPTALIVIAIAAPLLWAQWWQQRTMGTTVIALLDLDPATQVVRMPSIRDRLETVVMLIPSGRGFASEGWPVTSTSPLLLACSLLLGALIAAGVLSGVMTRGATGLVRAVAAGVLGAAALSWLVALGGFDQFDPTDPPAVAALLTPALVCAGHLLGRSWAVLPLGITGLAGSLALILTGPGWP